MKMLNAITINDTSTIKVDATAFAISTPTYYRLLYFDMM